MKMETLQLQHWIHSVLPVCLSVGVLSGFIYIEMQKAIQSCAVPLSPRSSSRHDKHLKAKLSLALLVLFFFFTRIMYSILYRLVCSLVRICWSNGLACMAHYFRHNSRISKFTPTNHPAPSLRVSSQISTCWCHLLVKPRSLHITVNKL